MRLFFRRTDDQSQGDTHVGVVIISGACCIPGMKPFDEQARLIVERAIAETGVPAQLKMMPATTAYFGGAPKEVMAQLMALSQSGQLGVPAVLVNGKAVSYGVPQPEEVKAALLAAAQAGAAKTTANTDPNGK